AGWILPWPAPLAPDLLVVVWAVALLGDIAERDGAFVLRHLASFQLVGTHIPVWPQSLVLPLGTLILSVAPRGSPWKSGTQSNSLQSLLTAVSMRSSLASSRLAAFSFQSPFQVWCPL